MNRDVQLLLSDAQAITVDAVSSNTYDLALATNDISSGEPMVVLITVDVAADSTTGDETYAFELIQSASANLGTATVLSRIPFVAAQAAAGLLAAGKQVVLPIPAGSITQRYLGVNYDTGGTTPTITCTAQIMALRDVPVQKYPPKNFTVTSA